MPARVKLHRAVGSVHDADQGVAQASVGGEQSLAVGHGRATTSEYSLKWSEVSLFVLFACVVLALYHSALDSFWLYDDPYLLRNAAEHPLFEFFTRPEVWNLVGLSYLAPWQTLSLGLDYRLFALDSRLFYAHHLVSLWLSSCVLYAVLRLWWRPLLAASGALLYLMTAPAAAAAEMLMIRHYVEGLIFCAAGVWCFVRAVRENSLGLALASALFYFLSMSAKEVYVPALIVFAVLPEGDRRTRLRALVPAAMALVLYLVWRHHMLGGLLTSRGKDLLLSSVKGPDPTLQLLENMYSILLMQVGASRLSDIARPLFAVAFLLAATSSTVLLVKKRNYGALIFHAVLFLSVYLLPLSLVTPFSAYDLMSFRFVLLVSAYNCAVFVSAAGFIQQQIEQSAQSAGRRRVSRASALMLAAVGVIACMSSVLWAKDMRRTELKPLVEEGRFFMAAGPDDLLIKSQPVWPAPFYYENLNYFKQASGRGMGATAIYGPFAFVERPEFQELERNRAFKYEPSRNAMVDVTEAYRKERRDYLSRVEELPLKVRLEIKRSALDYSVASPAGETCFALLGYRPGLYCMVLRASEFKTGPLNTSLRMNIRFGCESHGGKIVFSPEWLLDYSLDRKIAWERK
jgi:hypothetical protein